MKTTLLLVVGWALHISAQPLQPNHPEIDRLIEQVIEQQDSFIHHTEYGPAARRCLEALTKVRRVFEGHSRYPDAIFQLRHAWANFRLQALSATSQQKHTNNALNTLIYSALITDESTLITSLQAVQAIVEVPAQCTPDGIQPAHYSLPYDQWHHLPDAVIIAFALRWIPPPPHEPPTSSLAATPLRALSDGLICLLLDRQLCAYPAGSLP